MVVNSDEFYPADGVFMTRAIRGNVRLVDGTGRLWHTVEQEREELLS